MRVPTAWCVRCACPRNLESQSKQNPANAQALPMCGSATARAMLIELCVSREL